MAVEDCIQRGSRDGVKDADNAPLRRHDEMTAHDDDGGDDDDDSHGPAVQNALGAEGADDAETPLHGDHHGQETGDVDEARQT